MASAFDPIPNVPSQLERAVVAYLKAFFGDEAAGYNWYFADDNAIRTAPAFDVIAHNGAEDPIHTEREIIRLSITFTWPGGNQIGAADSAMSYADKNRAIGLAHAAMRQTNDYAQTFHATGKAITDAGRALATTGTAEEQTANADMLHFTARAVESRGFSRADSDGADMYLRATRYYDITCIPANVD